MGLSSCSCDTDLFRQSGMFPDYTIYIKVRICVVYFGAHLLFLHVLLQRKLRGSHAVHCVLLVRRDDVVSSSGPLRMHRNRPFNVTVHKCVQYDFKCTSEYCDIYIYIILAHQNKVESWKKPFDLVLFFLCEFFIPKFSKFPLKGHVIIFFL